MGVNPHADDRNIARAATLAFALKSSTVGNPAQIEQQMISPHRETDETRTLGSKIASGTFWTVAMRMSTRLIGVISIVILARVLVPADFGIVAQASMFYSFIELITALGLETALIQNQAAVRDHYDTVWTLNVMRGLVNAILLAAVAYPASIYLHEPRLHSVIYFYAMASLVQGFANVGTVDFRKGLDFNRDFLFALWSKLAGFVVSIGVALIWRNYWAFVAGVLSGTSTTVATSYLMSSYRPRFSLSMWRPLFHFSKWVLGAELFGAVSTKLDVFILSRFSSVESVGVYTASYEIAGTPSTEIAMPVARALMPGLSKVGNDPEKFRSLYLSTMGLVLLIAIPAGIGVSVLAAPITHVLLGDKWTDAVALIQILAIFGITRAVFAVSASAYISFGRVDLLAKVSLANLVINCIGITIGVYLGGTNGVALGVLAASFCQLTLTLLVQMRIGILDGIGLIGRSWRVVAAGIVMGTTLTLWHGGLAFTRYPTIVLLFIEVGLGAAVFCTVVALLWRLSPGVHAPERVLVEYISARLARATRK